MGLPGGFGFVYLDLLFWFDVLVWVYDCVFVCFGCCFASWFTVLLFLCWLCLVVTAWCLVAMIVSLMLLFTCTINSVGHALFVVVWVCLLIWCLIIYGVRLYFTCYLCSLGGLALVVGLVVYVVAGYFFACGVVGGLGVVGVCS